MPSNSVSKNSPLSMYKIVTWLRGFRHKIANFSRLHCLAVPRSDLSTIKTHPKTEILTENIEVMSEK